MVLSGLISSRHFMPCCCEIEHGSWYFNCQQDWPLQSPECCLRHDGLILTKIPLSNVSIHNSPSELELTSILQLFVLQNVSRLSIMPTHRYAIYTLLCCAECFIYLFSMLFCRWTILPSIFTTNGSARGCPWFGTQRSTRLAGVFREVSIQNVIEPN